MGPLCTPLKDIMRRIEKLFDEASKCTSFTRRVEETSEQPDQQRINRSGNTPNFTKKGERVTAYPAIKITGREKDLEKIKTMLHDSSSNENVIGIYGIPGSGKTTLAQYVYQSEKEGGHFDLVMWIHVSEYFSVDAIFKRMFEEASPNKETACPPFNSLNALLTQLENKLNGKRLLLFLDDIWDNNTLPELVSPFKFGSTGSKILVTSRDESALRALGPDVRCKPFAIPRLDDKEFFDLLMYYAGVDTRDRGPLHTIGEKIAQRLKGSPLVARLVGGILSKELDINVWRTVLDREHLNETLGADLWWCYQHLDENVRRCFAFCSIFPRGHHLFRDELVNLWVAEGFIRMTNEGEEMEDVGREYFRELMSTSFLQRGVKHVGKDFYLVHDLLHDLAVEVAGSDCFGIRNVLRLSGNEWSSSWSEVHPDVRHLFVLNYNAALITGKILKLENLRTLIICIVPNRVSVEYEVIKSIFHRLRKLRVLVIGFTHQIHQSFSVPESICQSKHLRYLAFQTFLQRRVTFPSTPTKLYHLWLLDVGAAKGLEFSCDDFTNLRHLLGKCVHKLPNMGKMISLQTLLYFQVSKEPGCDIKQLRDLNKLRGSLVVTGLENVMSKVEALEANLATKEGLRKLTLEWCAKNELDILGQKVEVEAEVLDGLRPPMGLETLHIKYYYGWRYPNWMLGKQNGGPMYLKELELSHCSQPGPPPELKAFIHLESLAFVHCSWHALPESIKDLTSLKRLTVDFCLNVMWFPTLPQSVEQFTFRCGDVKFMESCKKEGHSNWHKIKHIPRKCITIPRGLEHMRGFIDGGDVFSFSEEHRSPEGSPRSYIGVESCRWI